MISRRRLIFSLGLSAAFAAPFFVGAGPQAQTQTPPTTLKLPLKEGSIRFAVMGDTGRGDKGQYETAKQMIAFHNEFPFDLVIMAGDNIYGGDSPAEMQAKFETPYKPLLDAGVRFQASLGNHDNPNQRFYKLFNMGDSAITPSARPKGARCGSLPSTATT